MRSEERANYQKCVARIVGGPGVLSINLTDVAQWIPETPLKRGVVYKWAVTAIVNGKEVSSPAASAPEARFGILDQEKTLELSSGLGLMSIAAAQCRSVAGAMPVALNFIAIGRSLAVVTLMPTFRLILEVNGAALPDVEKINGGQNKNQRPYYFVNAC